MRSPARNRTVFGIACLCVLGLTAFLGTGAPSVGAAESFPGQGFLPHNRAWEMVSPPDKLGADIIPDSQRTRAAEDGDAVGYISLGGFGDVQGTTVSTDYLARRSSDPNPGDNGWATHAITPVQKYPIPLNAILSQLETLYDGELSPDLDSGVVMSYSPLTNDPNVEDVVNLYRRTDLLSPGAGSYDLLSACPLCESTDTPLPPLPDNFKAEKLRPLLAWASPDFDRIAFESNLNLTADAPPQPGICEPDNLFVSPATCRPRAYEWDEGTLRLAGILDDPALCAAQTPSTGAPCAADGSIPGEGVGSSHVRTRAPHAISDGSDGHSRVFFTQPTDAQGRSSSFPGLSEIEQQSINGSSSGRLFMRLDGSSTEQLNLSERAVPDDFAPATYLDASADGTRVFFMTGQALTDDALADGQPKIYLYDASKPGTAPDNLTLLSLDGNAEDGANSRAVGLIGASEDGRYVYMVVAGQLVDGEPALEGEPGIYLWHDGAISFIGSMPDGTAIGELLSSGIQFLLRQQARVTPDGLHLLLSAIDGSGLTGEDHGTCETSLGSTCRELYVYSAEEDELECASCNPSGAPPGSMATAVVRADNGGAQTSLHRNRAISDDGRYVFFSTGEQLVPGDVNGICEGFEGGSNDTTCVDAYVYDTATGEHHLLSSGRSSSASYFLDASADGRDAFILTRERLSGWDVDGSYDLYDARVGGGFPEPPPPPPGCVGDACQPAPLSLNDPTPGSATVGGPGDPRPRAARKARRCPNGKRRIKARSGKTRCVKRKRAANTNRRAGR